MTSNAFVAIDPTDRERHDLAAALMAAGPGPPLPGRRVRPENWHITLRFLGPVDDVTLDRLAHELEDVLDAEPVDLLCSGLGAFPRASRATVIYVGVEDPTGILDAVAATCETACRELGLEPEERPFTPHVTLARVRPPVDVRRTFERFTEFRSRIRADRVSIMRTHAERGGVRYETLETITFG